MGEPAGKGEREANQLRLTVLDPRHAANKDAGCSGFAVINAIRSWGYVVEKRSPLKSQPLSSFLEPVF